MARRSSTWSWVSIPSEQATLMSTASWIALIPSRTCGISRSSGPRTAATMQNSVAPVAAVSSAAFTSCGMSSHTDRTGEVNWPDWLQKWQSSGQPPVLRLMIPSTSISGPQCFMRTACASSSSSAIRSSGTWSTSTSSSYERPVPSSRTLTRARSRMSVTSSKISGVRRLPAMTSPATPEQLLAYDREHVWHPYTSMTDPTQVRLVTRAKGCRLRLADGREVIDGMSSWWAATHGYRHPALDAALKGQGADFAHVMFAGLTHEPAIRLAQRLVELTPPGLDHVFLADSGSVSVEVALKMALQYQRGAGRQERT